MDTECIAAAVLFGPAALALPAIAVAWHRGQRRAAAERAVFMARYPSYGAPVERSRASAAAGTGALATVTELGARSKRLAVGAGGAVGRSPGSPGSPGSPRSVGAARSIR